MLDIEKINTYYWSSHVLFDLSLHVPKGSIVSLLGRNGMGKTTIMRSIVGLTPPRDGVIKFKGEQINGLEPHKIARKGIAYVPQGRGIFPSLSVKENLTVGARGQDKPNAWTLDRVYDFFPILKKRENLYGNLLSGGEQQMLAVGRALMSRPKLIMMDEPSLGLAPIIVKGIFDIIREINRRGVTVLLIEQNANMALKIADRAFVMETGSITMSGTGKELLENEAVKAAYLGT